MVTTFRSRLLLLGECTRRCAFPFSLRDFKGLLFDLTLVDVLFA